ncbi:hypothetical protein [Micropruina sonneratiae]|uniref:hypothetical protein n=1 Tax=Micropruina sonneratiae TaxID=2986940 RepID=UPI00222644A2|nr:hypothetical protein [Micropruina sp. KQZ13P-5]MCW3157566.1 hypothetical protein [Micropruina sp. KQZ13P-5]
MEHMFTMDLAERPGGGWGWDRRRLDVPAFDDMMATREVTGEIGPPPAGLLRPAPLGRDAFDRAVALRSSICVGPTGWRSPRCSARRWCGVWTPASWRPC